jgi:hypothetical protein
VAKASKLLVIDASVARSCGDEHATYPTSKNCRDFLQAVLNICHRFVITPDIKSEWDKHQSNFARKWRVKMVARKKFYYSDMETNEALRQNIDDTAQTDIEREAMWKDCHLIEAALATDKTIISLDEKARQPFHKAAGAIAELRAIVWVNPDKSEEIPITWLINGAQVDKRRLLGFQDKDE